MTGRLVAHHEITWRSEPIEQLERLDILTLDDRQLLEHVADLKLEITWLRRLLSEALTTVARQTDALTTKSRTIESLRREFSVLRKAAA
jgi:CHASE3 domain sensor protein